ESRVTELLKLAKKSINSLTNRKISYIIVTGGITELTGFGYVVENVLGMTASTLNITTIGIRNNKYSTAIVIIKYFYENLKLIGIEYSMFDEYEVNKSLNDKKNSLNINNETIVSKIFGYFTNN
ncbi:MAG: cell division FtsA domain-containing protein, partial [bacterium]|nr:cell division FtsA domain-containing protein [bacterium]